MTTDVGRRTTPESIANEETFQVTSQQPHFLPIPDSVPSHRKKDKTKRKSHPLDPFYVPSLTGFTSIFLEELSMPILSAEKRRLRIAQKLASSHVGRSKPRSEGFPGLVCVCTQQSWRKEDRGSESLGLLRSRETQTLATPYSLTFP